MAVELSHLYEEIYSDYEVRLLTASCFGKTIGWMHVIEDSDLTYFLHGDELVFNSRLSFESQERQKEFIDRLVSAQAGGLVVAAKEKEAFSQEIINYCNKMRFPLFWADWQTFYQDIMHKFAKILLEHERNETNLIAALKNAIYYPKDEKLYLRHFERNGFSQNSPYTIILLGGAADDTEKERFNQVAKALRYFLNKNISFEEDEMLVVLAAGYPMDYLKEEFGGLCSKYPDVRVGIGSLVEQIQDIHDSYKNAFTAYRLTEAAIPQRVLSYEDLGAYQLLAEVKNPAVLSGFVDKVLGELIRYDEENETEYVDVLECFFENECSMVQTAEMLYYHKNTLKYKMKKIKEVLGYDIASNENRVRIILAFYIRKMLYR